MSVTVDCGEGKHDVCSGHGRKTYLIPQRDGEEFECDCPCHTSDTRLPALVQKTDEQLDAIVGRFTDRVEHAVGDETRSDIALALLVLVVGVLLVSVFG